MLIKENPIFTTYDVRRAIAAGLVSEDVHVAQLGVEEARWVADLEHDQTKLTVDLFAIGLDDTFTADRGVEVEITSRDNNSPMVKFSVKESSSGISYIERGSPAVNVNEAGSPFRVEYAFRAPLSMPRQVTPQDLVSLGSPKNLSQNQILIADILRLAGVPLLVPKPEK